MSALTYHQAPTFNETQRVQGAILGAVCDDTALVGTLASLARGLATTESMFRSCIRDLLAADWIAVEADGHGQLTIRQLS